MTVTWGALHAPTMADAAGLAELINLRAGAIGSPSGSTGAAIESWWNSSDVDLADDVRIATDERDRIVGFASVSRPSAPYAAIHGAAVVRPDAWGCEALWDELHKWVARRAEAHALLAPPGVQVSLFTEAVEQDVRRVQAIGRAGYALARLFFRMEIDLRRAVPVPTVPEGVTVRPMGADELPDLAAVHVEAFRDHWGHGEQSPEEFAKEWLEETEGQSPGFSYVAVCGDGGSPAGSGGPIVGYALCEDRYRGDRSIGHINVLGVLKPWRGRGIGLALLRTAFHAYQQAGYTSVRLGVDADSPTGATHLYERAGMAVIERINRYERVLRDGTNLLNRQGG